MTPTETLIGQPTIQTFTGKMFDILDPKHDQICIEDIAHALSMQCRFTGHTKFHYSVAQHSYLGSFVCQEPLWFLLHDASEAYICDMSRPLKHFTGLGALYQTIEAKIMKVICERFGISTFQPSSVHNTDTAMLYAEKSALMRPCEWSTKWGDETPADVKIEELTTRTVELLFLKRYQQLREI